MLDQYNRHINYLRVSVTDRCNLRCSYCMPENDPCLLSHEDILSFEEIREVVATAVSMGIDKVRLTGGEPLVRRDIIDLVKMISGVTGVRDLSMTTNATLLSHFAGPLAEAGLHRINISLDTMDPEKFRELTRGGDIRKVFAGIRAAKKAGLSPIKVNCVLAENEESRDAMDLKNYCLDNGLKIRFIKQMDLKSGHFSVVEGGSGGDCRSCNRLRLTSDGKIKPCLFSDIAYDIRVDGTREALEKALRNKPEKGTVSYRNCFHSIGG